MSDSIIPITLHKTSVTGVLATGIPNMGKVQSEMWSLTTYPQGNSVTKVVYNTVSVYDNRAALTEYNRPNQLDVMA